MGSPPLHWVVLRVWGGKERGGAKNWGGVSGTPPQKGEPIGESWDAQGGERMGSPPSIGLY